MGRIESKVVQAYSVLSTLTGSGTSGTIAKWTGANSLGDAGFTEADILALLTPTTSGTQTLVNNQVAAASVTSVAFNSATERGVIVEYDIYRNTDTASDEVRANGRLRLLYRVESGIWEIEGQEEDGDAHGITFSISAGGQLQYASSNMAGANYVGKMVWSFRKFSATGALSLNNAQAATAIGVTIDPTLYRGALVEYDISRKTDTAASEVRASGKLRLIYRAESSAWEVDGQESDGDDVGITFTISALGVLQYASTNIAGANYVGNMQYNLRRFSV